MGRSICVNSDSYRYHMFSSTDARLVMFAAILFVALVLSSKRPHTALYWMQSTFVSQNLITRYLHLSIFPFCMEALVRRGRKIIRLMCAYY